MHFARWGLVQSPFAGGATPREDFVGESLAEATARLRYVAGGGLIASIEGVRGVGKSTLITRFAKLLRRQGRTAATIDATGLSAASVLWHAAGGFALGPQRHASVHQLHCRLADYAAGVRHQRAISTLLIDNIDRCDLDVPRHLIRLLGAGAPWAALVVTAAQRVDGLSHDLADRLDLRIELEPWSQSETAGYIHRALSQGGCRTNVFDAEAILALHHLSDGVPRRVNRLADHALLVAAAADSPTIDAGTIEAAHDALAGSAVA